MRISRRDALALEAARKLLRDEREAISKEYVRVTQVALPAFVQDYNEMVRQHNLTLAQARTLVESVAANLRDSYDGKSERWQNGEAGQSALSMVEEWEAARLEDVGPMRVLTPDAPLFEEGLNLPEESD